MKMNVLLVTFCVLVTARVQALDKEDFITWVNEHGAQSEMVQEILDIVIDGLMAKGDEESLMALSDALSGAESTVERRETDDQKQQSINEGKVGKGHCCLGGKMTVTYTEKEIVIPVYHSTQTDTNTANKNCGTFGWRRCSVTTSTKSTVYYTSGKTKVKVAHYTCGVENAVCCHGYVSVKKLPGEYAAISENSCAESRVALFTIFNLQLLEKATTGGLTLTPDHMTKILNSLETFFVEDGITGENGA